MTINLFLGILFMSTMAATGSAQSPGHVKGTIVDSNGAVVTNVTVAFKTNGQTRKVVTNQEGYYEIELPIGLYRVTTHVPGFCASQRALFRVQPSSNILLNLTLTVCPLAHFLKMDKSGRYVGEEARYIDPFESESFRIRTSSGARLNLLIRYGQHHRMNGTVEYQGTKVVNGVPSGVTISYDVLTIVADKVRLNKKTLLLQAEGNVIVEDGKRRMTFAHVEVNFKSKDPVASLKGTQ
jgi:hypothetical protein